MQDAKTIPDMDREVIQYLDRIFLSLHRVDLDTWTVRTFLPSAGTADAAGSSCPYPDYLELSAQSCHPVDRTRFLREFSQETLLSERDKEATRYERDYRRLVNGSYRWVSICVYLNGTAGSGSAILVQTDVSYRHLSRNLIEALGEEYYALYYMDLLEDSAQILRSDRNVTENLLLTVSSRFSEMLHKYGEAFVHPEDLDTYSRCVSYSYLRSTLSPETKSVTFPYRKKIGGHYEWMEMKLVLNESSDNVPRFVTLAIRSIDSTMKQQAETRGLLQDALDQAQLASLAKSRFLSRISHDIRTPLNTIMGMTTLAETHLGDPERLTDCLNKITVAGSHLLGLINEILDMAHIENGHMDLEAMDFDLKELILEAAGQVAPYANNAGQDFIVDTDRMTHTRVVGDGARLKQVFINILANAVKYTGSGGTIRMSLEELPWNGASAGHYRFICEDNGVGISPEFLPHIFEPFSREKDSRINSIAGTGLGLTIAHSIISMMDGEILIDSKPGMGSVITVTFSLPVKTEVSAAWEPYAGQKHLTEANPVIAERGFFGRRFLIVDDNELNLDITCEMMELTGAATDCARNGKEAVEKYLSQPNGYYDLILMDVQMPVMNGLDAVEAIRSSDRLDAETIPVIALTANTFTEDVKLSMEHGMTAHLAKPINLNKMLNMIQKVLEL